ncbi:WSC domain-containing protein [Mycena sanguinolenta]|nr:WSC domain-containing protein [Mycena sanguinolenta]
MFFYCFLPFALALPAVALAAQVHERGSTLSAAAPAGWTQLGCFTDQTEKRILAGSVHTGNNMSIEACISYCNLDGFSYAGLDYGRECYCDIANHAASPAGPVSDCNMPCAGNASESCGAGLRMRVYNKLNTPQPATPSKGTGKWESIGCYKDAAALNRVLQNQATIKGNMTVESCISACQAGNFSYAGLEYSSECWCGNTHPSAPADKGSCNMACPGNKTEICGGKYALNVFQTQPDVATICKETTTDFDFKLTAVKKADGSQSLLVIAKTEKNELILTDCSNCSTPYVSQILIHGELLAIHSENTTAAAIANTTVVSSSVNKGDTVVFKHTFEKSSTKFCTLSNPDDDGETDLLG